MTNTMVAPTTRYSGAVWSHLATGTTGTKTQTALNKIPQTIVNVAWFVKTLKLPWP